MKILALCLSTRKNLCIHEEVSQQTDWIQVDRMCWSKTSSWQRLKVEAKQTTDIEDIAKNLCTYYEGWTKQQDEIILRTGILTLEDLKEIGKEKNVCPYFLVRDYLARANVCVFNYSYLLDPKISEAVTKSLQEDSIIVFDECHNIDNACIEGFTMNLNRPTLRLA